MLFGYSDSMDSHFELRHLRYFVAVAQEKNITRAAARLFVTQPALSRQIRDLEKILGVELLIRAPGGLTLTPAGQEFLPLAQGLLEQGAEAALAMRRFGECRRRSLAIGYIAPTLGSFLGAALQVFGQRHPQIEIKLFEIPPGRQIEALREGRLDIALVGHACGELDREVELVTLRRIPLDAVLPAVHPLAKRKSLKLTELRHERFVGLDEATFPGRREVIEDAARVAGFTPRIAHSADGLSSMLALIGSGAGVGLVPEEVQHLPHPHAVFIPLRAPKSYIDFRAAVCLGEKRPAVRAMLAELRTAASG